MYLSLFSFFFFNDTATTEIYTLALHDALPIFASDRNGFWWTKHWRARTARHRDLWRTSRHQRLHQRHACRWTRRHIQLDRKSTRLNSSHLVISYAVFCLKKKTRIL